MKRATFVLVVVSSAFTIGCSAGSSDQLKTVPKGYPKGAAPAVLTPEATISKLETPEDRATYLHQLGKDSAFEPQKHAEMLEKYSADSDQEVATAAKELLDRKN